MVNQQQLTGEMIKDLIKKPQDIRELTGVKLNVWLKKLIWQNKFNNAATKHFTVKFATVQLCGFLVIYQLRTTLDGDEFDSTNVRSFANCKPVPKCYDAQMLFHKLKTPFTSSSLRHTPYKFYMCNALVCTISGCRLV